MASLAVLREIERERQLEEQAAIVTAAEAKQRERERAAQAARDAEAAWLAAERDAKLAVELARADAEREARLAIEAREAAERARFQIALDDQRRGEELAIERERIRRQRPRWMLAVTGLAIAAAIALSGFAVSKVEETRLARLDQERAQLARDQAKDEAQHARAQALALAGDVDNLQHRINDAIARVDQAHSDAVRQDQADRDRAARQHEADLAAERHKKELERLRKERQGGVSISADCLTNALCK